MLCNQFLQCNLYFQDARGDQCDKCGRLINATELKVVSLLSVWGIPLKRHTMHSCVTTCLSVKDTLLKPYCMLANDVIFSFYFSESTVQGMWGCPCNKNF